MEDFIKVTAETFAKQLREIRQEKSLTQKDLAEMASVSQQTISAIERGKLDPSLKLLLILVGVLGVSLLISTFGQKGGNRE
ncbi:MAG: helix-turn-helix transcriptional regulator [Peptococcaceae bacterium]|jgi:putative transcriptional regulator|nr:helix-turn-helix transcriptional regulator [Peptococcaceae bacterium]